MNHGLNLELEMQHRSEKDWMFGALSQPCLASIPSGEREKYLPKGEVQRGVEDFQDCASRSALNILETKFNYLVRNKKLSVENYLWLHRNGYVTQSGDVEFSDRYTAVNSGTTRQGNSLIAPLEAIRTCGLIPKKLLPALPTMTFDQYHDASRITAEMITLGKEFRKRFTINYERVLEVHMDESLKDDCINTGGYAWPNPVNGVYPRTNNPANHAFMVYDLPKYQAFDNYLDFDGDFIKKLAPDYDLVDFGYRVYISAENTVIEKKTFWQKFLDYLYEIIR